MSKLLCRCRWQVLESHPERMVVAAAAVVATLLQPAVAMIAEFVKFEDVLEPDLRPEHSQESDEKFAAGYVVHEWARSSVRHSLTLLATVNTVRRHCRHSAAAEEEAVFAVDFVALQQVQCSDALPSLCALSRV